MKSLVFWTFVYRFRRRLTVVAVLIAIILLSQWIYSDTIKYLQLIDKTNWIGWVLIAKWLLILSSTALSVYLILTIFRTDIRHKKRLDPMPTPTPIIETDRDDLTPKERSFLTKKLRSRAEILKDR
jgi:hypothetical protein